MSRLLDRPRLRRRQTSAQRSGSRRDLLDRRLLGFEPLERRWLLAVDLSLAGTQTLVAGTNINASSDQATQQQNMAIDINPINPLHVTGVSERNTPTTGTSLGLYHSVNGGLTWTTRFIDNSVDGLSATAIRFDPSVAYDATGKLYVAYGVNDLLSTGVTTLIVAVSTDDGATFSQISTVDTRTNLTGSLRGFRLATGPDGLGGQGAYVAYSEVQLGVLTGIEVAGSNNGFTSFVGPTVVSDSVFHALSSASPSVGPTGQLYVSWLDATSTTVFLDRDLDGMFIGGNTFGADITVVNNATPRPTLAGNFNLFTGLTVPASPNHGISSDPQLSADRSGKPATNGNLYISFVDLFSAPNSDADIYVARSINQGATWTFVPVGPTGSTNFMPSIDVDQASGSVNLLYYSTAGDTATGNDDVNVELSASIDGGLTYTGAQQLTSATSRASAIVGGNDFGDYNGLAVLDGTLQGLWADNRGLATDSEAFTASASYDSATNGNVLTVTGTAGDDAIVFRRSVINPAFIEVTLNGTLQYVGLLATLDSAIVNALAGNDTLTIDHANGLLNAPVTFNGGAAVGETNTVIVDDHTLTTGRDYKISPTTLFNCAPTAVPIVLYDNTVQQVQLDATQGADRFDVIPSTTATYTIHGNNPTSAGPGADFLSVEFAGTTGRKLTYDPTTGNGNWMFTSHMPIIFTGIEKLNYFPILVYAAEAAAQGRPTVKVVDAETGTLITSFQAYESTYRGGVRVAVGDINGDGIPEIITAPGRNHTPLVEVWSIVNATAVTPPTAPIESLLAYNAPFRGGVNLAVGDVNGDGLNDLITAPDRGKVVIHTYLNQSATAPTMPFDNNHLNVFVAFGVNFQGGATVAAGDVLGDARAEIIVGSGPGMRDVVRIFDGATTGPLNAQASFLAGFFPFPIGNRGGVNVAVGNLDADAKLEIIAGANVGGQSRVSTFDTANLNVPTQQFFAVYTGSGFNAPVRVAAVDSNGDGLSDIFAAQGFDGKSQTLRRSPPLGSFVDFLMENDPEFRNGFFIAADASAIAPFLC
jgi:hypothetical protein